MHFPVTKTVGHSKCDFVRAIERAATREREKPSVPTLSGTACLFKHSRNTARPVIQQVRLRSVDCAGAFPKWITILYTYLQRLLICDWTADPATKMHTELVGLVLICTALLTDVTHATERRWRRKDTKKREEKQGVYVYNKKFPPNISMLWFILTELWNQDASDLFKIDPSTQGIKKVNLKCGSNSMLVFLETDDDFTGVMYTKGNFYDQAEPCFTKPKSRVGARSLIMRFPFDKCNTKQVNFDFECLEYLCYQVS